jgi:hypothetical protein
MRAAVSLGQHRFRKAARALARHGYPTASTFSQLTKKTMSIFNVFAALDFFSDTIYHAPAIGFTGSGSAIYGEETAYAARIVRKQQTVVGKSGEIAASQAQIWMATPPNAAPPSINFGDRIRVPDGVLPNGTMTSEIASIAQWSDGAGLVATKVYL